MPANLPLSAPRSTRTRQHGMVTVVVMLFLIATVIFALSQMLNVSSGNVIDGQRQGDSAAAFFLAESGLEKAQADIGTALGASYTHSSCTAVASSYSLGRGTVSTSAASVPPTCTISGGTPCTACTVTSTGTVGVASRSITQDLTLTSANGTSCNASASNCTNASAPPPTWKLNLRNTYAAPAIALFSLAARRQGNNTGANCTHSACQLEWNINSQNGANSVGSMGNAVSIPSGGNYVIYQTLSSSYNLAEVGALFPGSSPGPTLTGRYVSSTPVNGGAAYWNEVNNGSGGTVGKAADSTGWTNDGTWTDPATDTCTTAPAPGSVQACTTWCHAGDTLVFGFSGSAASLADELSAVTFNTVGVGSGVQNAVAQNVAMTRVAKFPNSSIAGAPTNVYSEVWYASNKDYLSNATASSGGVVTGSLGAVFTGVLTSGSSNMTVSAVTGVLHVGDAVSCNGGGLCPAVLTSGTTTITGQTSGTTGGAGVYTLSAPCVNPNCGSRSDKTTSNKLEVTAVSSGYLSVGDTITGTGVTAGTTVSAIVGAGNVTGAYTVSTAQNVASTSITAAGATIHVTGGTVPTGGISVSGTRVSVRLGTGAFAANSTVLASPAPTATVFKVSAVPTTRLVNATICGGTCAFFQHGASVTNSFSITKSAGTGYWGAGFMCIKGVDITPQVVTSSSMAGGRWTEVVN